MTKQYQDILDTAIQLTFSRQFRHDFWGALGESIMRNYQEHIRWIRCEGWTGVRIFGMQIPGPLEEKEYTLSLLIINTEFKYVFGLDGNNEDVKLELKNIFHYINNCFISPAKTYNLLALDWFWHLRLLSKGLITTLRKALIEPQNNGEAIIAAVDKVIDSFDQKQPTVIIDEDIDHSLSDIIVEIISAYRDGYSDYNGLTSILRPYLKGKFLYLKSIEHTLSEKEDGFKSLKKRNVNPSILERFEKALKEDKLFLDLRTRMYDLFGIYLNNAYIPYFFIYNPFGRNFYYRGIVPELDGINLKCIADLERITSRSPIEEKILSDFNDLSALIKKGGLSQGITALHYIETLGQPFDEDLIKYLYESKKVFWTRNLKSDFEEKKPDKAQRDSINLIRYIERNVIGIYGGGTEKNLPFIFSPLISDGQYRGNFYIRGNEGCEAPGKIISIIQSVAEYISGTIENYYYDEFSKSCIESQSDSLDAILNNIPFLLNAEVAGYIPIIPSGNYNVCLIRGMQEKRACNIWAFRHATSTFECLDLKKLECRGAKSEGKCLWDELYRESLKLNDRTKLIIFSVKIADIVQELKKHTPEIFGETPTDSIDVRQAYANILLRDEFKNIINGTPSNLAKVLMAWELKDKEGDKKYLIWCLLDLSPWEFNKYKLSIIRKITTVSEIKNLTADLLKSLRTIKLQGHLLSNFPHITLKYVVDCLSDAGLPETEKKYIINYINRRGYYLEKTANLGEVKNAKFDDEIKICQEIKNIITINLFRKDDIELWTATKYADLFEVVCESCNFNSLAVECPDGGLGALYTILENIIHNAFSWGENKIYIPGEASQFKAGFKIKIYCAIDGKLFKLKIGDTTSMVDNGMKTYFTDNPFVVTADNTGLGLYSIYVAGKYISCEPPRLAYANEEGCITGCKYTYIFTLKIKEGGPKR